MIIIVKEARLTCVFKHNMIYNSFGHWGRKLLLSLVLLLFTNMGFWDPTLLLSTIIMDLGIPAHYLH